MKYFLILLTALCLISCGGADAQLSFCQTTMSRMDDCNIPSTIDVDQCASNARFSGDSDEYWQTQERAIQRMSCSDLTYLFTLI